MGKSVHGWMDDGWMDDKGLWVMDKQHVVHPCGGILRSQEKEWRHKVQRGWTLNTRCSVREAGTEGHAACDCVGRKRPEQADPQRQEVD